MTPPPEGGVVDSRRPDGSAGQDVGGTPASRSKTRAAGSIIVMVGFQIQFMAVNCGFMSFYFAHAPMDILP